MSRLDYKEVEEIRRQHLNGVSNIELSRQFNVGSNQIYRIVTFQRWKTKPICGVCGGEILSSKLIPGSDGVYRCRDCSELRKTQNDRKLAKIQRFNKQLNKEIRLCCDCGDEIADKIVRPGRDGLYRCINCQEIRKKEKQLAKKKIIYCDSCSNLITGKRRQKNKEGRYLCQECRRLYINEKNRIKKAKYRKTEEFRIKNLKRSKQIYWSDPEYYCLKQRARKMGSPIEILREILERDKVCQLCGSNEELQFDHVHPRSEGGKGTLENLQLLCRRCNTFKLNHFFLPEGGMMLNGR